MNGPILIPAAPPAPIEDNHKSSPTVDKGRQQAMLLREHLERQKNRRNSFRSNEVQELRNLVVLLRFSDQATRKVPPLDHLDILFNSEGGDPDLAPAGSLRDYFSLNSYGAVNVITSFAKFLSSSLSSTWSKDEDFWMTLSQKQSHYAENNYGLHRSSDMVLEALEQLESVDFPFDEYDLDGDGEIDGFHALHSGYGAEYEGIDCGGAPELDRIWSHKDALGWTSERTGVVVPMYSVTSASRGRCGSDVVRVGVLVHESGHFRGLPDLYDESFDGLGAGCYDAMSNSWGFDGTGVRPPNLSAWSRVFLGYTTPQIIEREGKYSLATSALESQVYRIDAGFPDGEYLLLENRQPIGFDADLPDGGGLAIWHVDESKSGQEEGGHPFKDEWPKNGRHYRVALLQADGRYDLELNANVGDGGDLWRKDGASFGARQSLGPGSDGLHPSSDSYQFGTVVETGVRLFDISESGDVMTFKISGPNFKAAAVFGDDGGVGIDPFAAAVHNKRTRDEKSNPTSVASRSTPFLFGGRIVSSFGFTESCVILYFYCCFLLM